MIGKPEWFAFISGGKDYSIRLSTWRGKDISIRPSTWQGWLYMAVVLGMLVFIFLVPDFWILNSETRKPIAIIWGFAGWADALHIWYKKLKERG